VVAGCAGALAHRPAGCVSAGSRARGGAAARPVVLRHLVTVDALW